MRLSPKNVCQSSQTFSAAITTATGQARALIHSGATNSPILRASPVNMHQREHGERQLQAQDHLAEDQQLPVPRSP